MDNKTVEDAIATIGMNRNKVTMVIKRQDGGTVTIPIQPEPKPVVEVVAKQPPTPQPAPVTRGSVSEGGFLSVNFIYNINIYS